MAKKLSSLFGFNKDVSKTARLIVLGHQKTGTTVIASLLSKISGGRLSNDPLYMIDQGKGEAAKFAIEGQTSISKLCRKYPKLFDAEVIKDPDFIFLYDDVKKSFCNAKMLFVIRDPRDTIRSICNRLKLTGNDVGKFPEISKGYGVNQHWELILSGELPEFTAAKEDRSNFIRNLAIRWCVAADVYLENKDEMTLVKYEDFRVDKESSIKSLASNLEISSDIPISEFVDIQYQPKGSADVVWETFFGKENLQMVEEICAKYVKLFNY